MTPKSFLILSCVFVAGCATPLEVDVIQAGDQRLNCQDIKGAIREANTFYTLADHEQGLTGTNAAAFLFFWPGLIVTYVNTSDAKDAARDRKAHLANIYSENGCDKDQKPPQAGSFQTLTTRLIELDELFKKGLITEDEFKEQRRKVLDAM